MKVKVFMVVFMFLLMLFSVFFSFSHIHNGFCSGSVLPKFYVDDDYNETTPGWQVDHFNRIQDVIDLPNCTNGDRIIVYEGVYYENLVINKSLDIFGEDSENTIIDGNKSGSVITVNCNNVDISTFTIRNSGLNDTDAGVVINAGKCHVIENIIKKKPKTYYQSLDVISILKDVKSKLKELEKKI